MLRAKLHSPLVVHAMTPKNTGEKWVDRFHRGISLGLAGRVDDAAFVLGTAQEDSAKLVALLPDAQAFERKLIEQIGVRRKALKFPVLDGLPWNLGNKIA